MRSELARAGDFHIQIGRRRYSFPTLQAVSEAYSAARDASGEGASTVPSAKVFDGAGKQIGHISYNGRIWPGATWQPGMTPLFDPYTGMQPLTAGEYFAAKAEDAGVPLRTLDNVTAALTQARKTGADAAMARLMLRHGRLTDEARAYVAREYPQ